MSLNDVQWITFEHLFEIPLRNGLNRPTMVRGQGVKMVNMGELFANPRIGDVEMARVPLSENEADRFLLRAGDLLFARQSLVYSGAGKCSIFTGANEPVTYEGHIIRARLDSSIADPYFYYYLFNSAQGRGLIETIIEQVAAAGIRGTDLAKLEVPLPPLAEQRAIARILGSLDDKIDLNRRINTTLEATARALFQSWFVDFDPVRAKAEGWQPVGMDAETAALFPDSFEDSVLGAIPRGWDVGTLGDIIEFAYGKALKAENRRLGNIPVYGSNGQVGWHNESLVNECGVIVGRKGNPGTVNWSHVPFFVIDTAFYVMMRDKRIPLEYIRFVLEQQNLPSLSADSAVPGLNRNLAYMNIVPVPNSSVLKVFCDQIRVIFEYHHSLQEQSRTLAQTRDALLPKLISGEVRVDEVEDVETL